MNSLRHKLNNELALSGFAASTQINYVRSVAHLAEYYHRPPDRISPQQVRDYLAYLVRGKGLQINSVYSISKGLIFFYRRVLHWSEEDLSTLRPRMKMPFKRPIIYSVEEIDRLLSCKGLFPRYRMFFMTAYATGMRLSEVCHLKVTDLLGDRHQIRVEQGKGKKDRYTILFPKLLVELRKYWRLYRPEKWVFPGYKDPSRPMCPRTVQVVFGRTRRAVGLTDRGSLHALRHSFATHSLEFGVPLHILQAWLGHSQLKTTAGYLHYVQPDVKKLKSPLDLIDLNPIKGK